jgi:cytochrome o ubiquinol oxidase subunit 2
MKTKFNIAVIFLLFVGIGIWLTVFMGSNNIPILDPKGVIAAQEKNLLVISALLMLIVVVPVIILTVLFAWVYRANNKKATYRPDWGHDHLAEILWWGIPSIIILILGVITWETSHSLNPFKPIQNEQKPVRIQVVALNWKWLFIYPEQGIATVNFIQFPVDRPINFEITADAPMNSFWIPQLGGQIYAMSAMRSKLHLMATEEGEFRGCSSNISGDGFAGMVFTAKVSSEEEFNDWVTVVKESPKKLNLEEYKELVKPTAYVPVSFYSLDKKDLFDYVVTQYSMPNQG